MPVFIFWIAYLFSPNTGKYIYFLKIHISPFLSSRVVCVSPSLHPIQYIWTWLTPHQPLFVFWINFNISSYVFLPQLPDPPHISSQDYFKPILKTNVAHTYVQHLRESKSAPTKAGDRTLRKRSQNENRKPVPWNLIRLLLFDNWKFTKPLNWKKRWTRQSTHWSHIYQTWYQNWVLVIFA